MKSINQLNHQTNYIYRVTAMHALAKLKSVFAKDDLNTLFKVYYYSILGNCIEGNEWQCA